MEIIKTKGRLLGLAVGAIGLGSCAQAETNDLLRPAYTPIAERFGYFQHNERLAEEFARNSFAFGREHAWNLFVGLNQPLDSTTQNSWPVWFSWPTTGEAFVKDDQVSEAVASLRLSPGITAELEAQALATENDDPDPSNVNLPSPIYPVPWGTSQLYPDGLKLTDDGLTARDGPYFINNGDIMIAVEALSQEGFDYIRNAGLYQQETLQTMHAVGQNIDLPDKYVSTKIMYWPVKATGLTALPVWNGIPPESDSTYFGYETWDDVVAIDPSGALAGQTVQSISYFYGLLQSESTGTSNPYDKPIPRETSVAKDVPIVGLDQFYYHQVTQEDWDGFTAADKAILDQSSRWLSNQPFEVGDYIALVAMHIFTKEVETWTMQSFWWSNTPDDPKYSRNRPYISGVNPIYQNYLLTDANQYKPEEGQQDLPVAVNPYIEGVIHPFRTNCRNCHIRAGYPQGFGKGQTNYSHPHCENLLEALTPESECLIDVTRSDFAWIIPDRAH